MVRLGSVGFAACFVRPRPLFDLRPIHPTTHHSIYFAEPDSLTDFKSKLGPRSVKLQNVVHVLYILYILYILYVLDILDAEKQA